MPKISKSAFKALVKKLRENPESLRDTKFPDASTSNTAVQTKNLRLDVHRDTKDLTMATGIVQANSQADDRTVRKFIKGKTGGGKGHRGTHQVIGEKIRFGLGDKFKINDCIIRCNSKSFVNDIIPMKELNKSYQKGPSTISPSYLEAQLRPVHQDQPLVLFIRLKKGLDT